VPFINTPKELIKIWTITNTNHEQYTYDAIGNRTTDGHSTYQYYQNSAKGNLSWIKYDGSWYYTYDASGNRTMKGKVAVVTDNDVKIDQSKEYWAYTWDLHNRLTNVRQFNGSGNPFKAVNVSYTYDAQNYRIKRTSGADVTLYAYGRQGAVTYLKNTNSATGVTLERTYAYLFDQTIGWTEKKTDNGKTTTTDYYAITDQLGSVTAIADDKANVVWSSEYLPFGNVAGAVGEITFDGFFTGKDIDSETGLTYHWNRWRSEDGSTFISEDPARDGINWYGYCGNNPMNSQDPTGLAPRNMTREQRVRYKQEILNCSETGSICPRYTRSTDSRRIGQEWDCADMVTYLSSISMYMATGAIKYYENLKDVNGGQLRGIPPISSAAYQDEDLGNITFYRNDDGTIDHVFQSPNVEVGTIGVFNNHVITVIEVQRDETGKITLIRTIEGHKTKNVTRDGGIQ